MGRALAMAVLLGSAATVAAAEPSKIKVVVLPFGGDEDLAIYGKPVADAVARGLGKDGLEVIAAGEGEPPPGDVVVALATKRDKKTRKVVLSAVVRDGAAELGRAAAKPVKVADLDAAAAELAKKLGDPVAAAAEVARVRKAEEAAKRPPDPPDEPKRPPDPPAADTRPAVVVFYAGGPTSAAAGAAMATMLDRIGHRAIVIPGIPAVAAIARTAHERGAVGAILVEVQQVDFKQRGVLTARARARVAFVDVAGRRVLDRSARTATLVGGRGDSHDVLVRYVMRQVADIVMRDVKVVLRKK
jgi:hypothetical protein